MPIKDIVWIHLLCPSADGLCLPKNRDVPFVAIIFLLQSPRDQMIEHQYDNQVLVKNSILNIWLTVRCNEIYSSRNLTYAYVILTELHVLDQHFIYIVK